MLAAIVSGRPLAGSLSSLITSLSSSSACRLLLVEYVIRGAGRRFYLVFPRVAARWGNEPMNLRAAILRGAIRDPPVGAADNRA
jgi:hypothetical protein